MPGRTLKNFSERSEPDRTTQRLADVGYLGKAGIDEFLGKSDVGILSRNPHDRSIEIAEELLRRSSCALGAKTERPVLLVDHHKATGTAGGGADGLPIVRLQGAQVDNLDLKALAGQLLGGIERFLDLGSVGNDGHIFTLSNRGGLTQGNYIVGPRVGSTGVLLPIKMLVLEEHDRIAAAHRGA